MAYRYEGDISRHRQAGFIMLEVVTLPKEITLHSRAEVHMLLVDSDMDTIQLVQESMRDIWKNVMLIRPGAKENTLLNPALQP